jgi:HK97 family phage portal protein
MISTGYGMTQASSFTALYRDSFRRLESVNRGVRFIVNGCCALDYDIKDSIIDPIITGIRQKTVQRLLNHRPNPYQTIQAFRQNIFTDFVLEGNAFIYWDGAFLYHLPAPNVHIYTDEKTFVKSYKYNGVIDFTPDEVIHIQDLSSVSIFRGNPRIESAHATIDKLNKMIGFQAAFFENGAIPGIVLETENTLSAAAKERTVQTWKTKYNPKNGARTPMIIDNGLKLKSLNEVSFKELDFENSVAKADEKILMALGVPPILLNGGNNANIAPNLRLFYLETVMPIIRIYVSAFERFFGYDVEAITANISALQPDIKELATYYTTLVNGGIMTPAEAREALRLVKLNDSTLEEIRVPANIAGSAVDPSKGGAPKKDSTSP